MKFITDILFMMIAFTNAAYLLPKQCNSTSVVGVFRRPHPKQNLSILLSDQSLQGSSEQLITPQNNCISFTVNSGTGCSWMCTYCASSLGTNNYYFTDGVCKYESGECVGNPQVGVTYTCCSA